jgi:hypothetical protein
VTVWGTVACSRRSARGATVWLAGGLALHEPPVCLGIEVRKGAQKSHHRPHLIVALRLGQAGMPVNLTPCLTM